MRNVLKAETLERKFPLLAVEHGCIVSKDADLTVAFEVLLPEIYTVTGSGYEAIHSAWVKAVRVLPDYSVVCKQDWFMKETYRPDFGGDGQSFLAGSYERHFNERPYLNHRCYLYLTKTTRERSRRRSDFSTLCRGYILPREITDKETASRFLEAVEQFERIMNDSGLVSLRRMDTGEITGSLECPGLVEKYFSLSTDEGATVLEDLYLEPGGMRIGDKRLCLHTLSAADDLPGKVETDMRYERMSTDRSDCRLSFAAPVGLLLSCNHIYSQYIFIDDAREILLDMEKASRNLLSLSRYSRSNAVNREWVEMYLDEAHTQGLLPVRCHCNVLAWSEDAEELRRVRNDTGSQLAMMECTPRHNTVDAPVLYWAGIPGNAGDFPAEESFHTFLEQAVCLFTEETNYRSSPSPFGIRLADRRNGIPVHVDISDEPMRRGIITNRNKFILGPSGSGKSFFTNHLVRNYYEQGAHVLLVDTGNSYQGLCRLINDRTHGEDGIYITYEEDNPIAFNPFYTDSGQFDAEKRESIKTLILTLWKREDEAPKRSEEVALSGAVNAYVRRITEDAPSGLQRLLRVRARRLPPDDGGEEGAREGLRHRRFPERAGTFLQGRGLRLPAELGQGAGPDGQALHRVRAGQHLLEQGAVAGGDADHHGDLHRQDAQAERHPQGHADRGVLEGADVRQHERLRAVSVQDRPQVFRRGDSGDAGGGRHRLVTGGEGGHHQQLGLQNPARPKKIHEQVRPYPDPSGADGEGEKPDTLHQSG